MLTAAARWRADLESWALPEHIVAAATQSPWIHPPELFDVPATIASSPSHDRAREAVPENGTVLDVGCGGGIAAFAIAPPAAHVIGVDHQSEMLAMFRTNATARALSCETVEGFWPAVAQTTPTADVVTSHHVAYNVADVVPFLRALNDHARRRVVLEVPDHHPLSAMNDAWRHFWRLERPAAPSSHDLKAVLEEMGVSVQMQQWSGPPRSERDLDRAAHFMRVRLCLPVERESEVHDFLAQRPVDSNRELTTLWWDSAAST